MAEDERAKDAQIRKESYREGKEEGTRIGIRYWELNRIVFKMINQAAQEKEFSGKMAALSDSENYLPNLYEIIEGNPNSEEIERQQKGLENLAQGHGFVMTRKGVYLNNKQ
ncbi:hypothetical protein K8R30_03340 [archaeon]|nr:hypothetical protein [archaeon]